MQPFKISLTITLKAPFNTASSQPARFGIDTPVARNHRDQIMIPGTLIQGHLIEQIENWGNAHFPNLVSRKGKHASEGTYLPQRKTLVFSDCLLQDDSNKESPIYTRIHIDPELGIVKRGAIQMIETVAKAGAKLKFKGFISMFAKDNNEAKQIQNELNLALSLITQLGGERTVGFGEINTMEVGEPQLEISNSKPISHLAKDDNITYTLQFDRPIVIADHRVNSNTFESETIIAGNVLKGAFINTLKQLGEEDVSFLDNVIFRHGMLMDNRHDVQPLSLVVVSDKKDDKTITKVFDLCDKIKPCLIKINNKLKAPKFCIDWKSEDFKEVHKYYKSPFIKKHLMVRTAISGDSRVAAESQLFSYNQVIHEYKKTNETNETNEWVCHQWQAEIDYHTLDENQKIKFKKAIDTVFSVGLYHVGKTKAHATLSIPPHPHPHLHLHPHPCHYWKHHLFETTNTCITQ